MSRETKLSTRVLTAIGELATLAVLFPYQITVNRKEHSLGIRSLLVSVKSERKENEEGKKSTDLTLNIPGFVFGSAKKTAEKAVNTSAAKKKLAFFRKKKTENDT